MFTSIFYNKIVQDVRNGAPMKAYFVIQSIVNSVLFIVFVVFSYCLYKREKVIAQAYEEENSEMKEVRSDKS